MLATRSAEAGSASAASMLAIGGVAWVDMWKGELCGLATLVDRGTLGLVDFGEAATRKVLNFFLNFFGKLYPNHEKSIRPISIIMSNTQDTQKTLEVKIRPYSNQNNQERPDQRGISRVHMCKEALMELGLQSGQACYLCKKDEPSDKRREAVAWLTAEKNLSKKVVQMSKTFQEVCGFKLADDLIIGAAGNVNIAGSIVLTDITTTEGGEPVPELSKEDKPHWEWYLRENLGRSYFSPFSYFL
jgi:hypothetical protein